MLPKAYSPLEEVFKTIAAQKHNYNDVEFHFIGSGKSPNDLKGYNIKPLAEKYGLWQSIVFEYPARIPYLDVLVHLEVADAVFILGSTEPHYTPSKLYQGVLAGKPILAILHSASTAVQLLEQSNAGLVLSFNGEEDLEKVGIELPSLFGHFKNFINQFDKKQVNQEVFSKYSAYAVTSQLAILLDTAYERN